MKKIEKDNPNRWFYGKVEGTGEDSLKVLGYVGLQGQTELETGLPILETFLTEEELQTAVNEIADNPNYYKDQVELEGDAEYDSKFTGESGIYQVGLRASEIIIEPDEVK